MYLSIVYVSSAVRLLSDDELLELLRVSRENNERDDLTGLLLYKDGNFMQAVEGPETAVQQLYDKIQKDPRHKQVTTLIRERIETRQFPGWTMGFANMHKLPPERLAGASDFLSDDFLSAAYLAQPRRAHVLLMTFRDNAR